MRGWAVLLVCCMAELPCAAAQAQPAAGTISGSVSTQHTTPLAGVDVKIIDATGLIVAEASSDVEGRFRAGNLTAGTYRIIAALGGFETVSESLVLAVNAGASVALDLPIARFAGKPRRPRRARRWRRSRRLPAASSTSLSRARVFRAPSACSRR